MHVDGSHSTVRAWEHGEKANGCSEAAAAAEEAEGGAAQEGQTSRRCSPVSLAAGGPVSLAAGGLVSLAAGGPVSLTF